MFSFTMPAQVVRAMKQEVCVARGSHIRYAARYSRLGSSQRRPHLTIEALARTQGYSPFHSRERLACARTVLHSWATHRTWLTRGGLEVGAGDSARIQPCRRYDIRIEWQDLPHSGRSCPARLQRFARAATIVHPPAIALSVVGRMGA